MKNAIPVALAIAAAVAVGYFGGSCAADAKAEAADAVADSLTAVSDSLGHVRTQDSVRFVADSARLADSVAVLEDSLARERDRRRQAERERRVAIDATDLASAGLDEALDVAIPLLPPELADTLATRRARETAAHRSEREAANRVVATLEAENGRLSELLSLSRQETANALRDRDGERELRLAETARADANGAARDAWRRAAGKWRLGTIGVGVLAVGAAVLILK